MRFGAAPGGRPEYLKVVRCCWSFRTADNGRITDTYKDSTGKGPSGIYTKTYYRIFGVCIGQD